MVGRSHSGSRSWLPVAARRWCSAKPAMTIFMQGDLLKGSIYHIHGRRSNSSLAGKPDALKGACPVWREAHGTGPLTKWYLAGCLPYGYLIAGVGIVCTVVTTTIAATAHLGSELQGLAAGLLNTSQQIGAALGTSLASVVATSVALASGGHPAVAATTGYQATLYLALVLAVITAALTVLIDEPRSPHARVHQPVSNHGMEQHLSDKLPLEANS